jgi:tRNA threonylcarbamoyladenosine biosynthesis protein TsaB
MDNSLFSTSDTFQGPSYPLSGPLLAIETSVRNASVALLVPSGSRPDSPEKSQVAGAAGRQSVVIAQGHLAPAEPTTSSLAPAIERLLAQFSLTASELSCVAVDRGPGSFTGLRVGIAFSKTLCFAAGVPIIGIQSLELVADMAAEKADTNKILVLLDAQREQYYAAGYVDGVETHTPRIADEKWIIELAGDGWALAGPGVEKLLKRTDVSTVVDAACCESLMPAAAALAHSALLRMDRLTRDVYRLQPLYIRPSAAEEKAASA